MKKATTYHKVDTKSLTRQLLTDTLPEVPKVDFYIMKSVLALNNLISLILLLVVGIIIGYEKRG